MSPTFCRDFIAASRKLEALDTTPLDPEFRERERVSTELVVEGLLEELAADRGTTLEPDYVPFDDLPFYAGEAVAFDECSLGHIVEVPKVPNGFAPVKPTKGQAEWIPLDAIRSLV